MTTSPLNRVVQRFRLGALTGAGGPTDGELLESFITERDEAAFESLVRRHGPMVMGVCRRVIGLSHDAEDAFQATFLVLVRKANSIVPRQALGNWLYGVAYRTALEARSRLHRRFAKERQVTDMPHPEAAPNGVWSDLQPILDCELCRLPDKYRLPIVLCELEGRSRNEVARQLNLPEGTLSSRLATARRKLAQRLSGCGLALSGGALAMLLSESAASASVPAPLAMSTVKAAALLAAKQSAAGVVSANVAALTEGVVKAMFMTKIKMTAAFLLVTGVLALTGGVVLNSRAQAAADPPGTALEQVVEQTSNQVLAQRPKKDDAKTAPTVTGKLEAVDAAANTVTLSTSRRPEGKTEKTYTLAKDVKVMRDRKEAKLADLKKGSQASLTLSADQKTVLSISVASPTIAAPLKSADATKNTITVTIGGGRAEKQDKTYQVAKDAKVTIDGKDATVADLKAGAMLTIVVDEANTITQIRTAARRDRNQDE
ncbi:MAG: RNA polymerase sigma factor [Gemmataceae bacterium]|nr:RNA polymerase sigma factor [Gemmataceae bacterium]MCI0740345.1 RNA polymerase sigma factor [Gemmataceae bacterium]